MIESCGTGYDHTSKSSRRRKGSADDSQRDSASRTLNWGTAGTRVPVFHSPSGRFQLRRRQVSGQQWQQQPAVFHFVQQGDSVLLRPTAGMTDESTCCRHHATVSVRVASVLVDHLVHRLHARVASMLRYLDVEHDVTGLETRQIAPQARTYQICVGPASVELISRENFISVLHQNSFANSLERDANTAKQNRPHLLNHTDSHLPGHFLQEIVQTRRGKPCIGVQFHRAHDISERDFQVRDAEHRKSRVAKPCVVRSTLLTTISPSGPNDFRTPIL